MSAVPSQRRGRRADPPEDHTSLTSQSVDVAARTGFLLRHNRQFGPNRDVATGKAMVAALAELDVPASPAHISNWERGTVQAPSSVIEAYEVVTRAEPGSLRGIVDTMRRCYDTGEGPSRRSDRQLGLDEVTERCEQVMNGRPRGIDWLRFADLLTADTVVLPTFLVREPVQRLVSETARSTGAAYLTRYEALASILDSPYSEVTVEALHTAIFDEHAQVVLDLVTVLSETPDADRVRWLATLLGHERALIVRGAAFAVHNALETGRLDEETLDVVSEYVLVAHREVREPRARRAVAEIIWSLPEDRRALLLRRVGDTGGADLPQPAPPLAVQERRQGVAIAHEVERAVARALGQKGRQPLLTRLIYELMCEERSTRRFHAKSLLTTVPYREAISTEIARMARTHSDESVREQTARAANLLGWNHPAEAPAALLGSEDPEVRRGALITSAHSQIPLDEELLLPLCRDDHPHLRLALYAAGMNGLPLIDRLAEDPECGPGARGGARWWRREGPAVLH
ncbi:MAG: hypothetical protein ACTH2Q_13295 [Propionibacteriaceae bacterium]